MYNNIKTVSLIKSKNSYDNIRQSLNLIRLDLDNIKGKRSVLIKPNLIATKNRFANADVKAVEAVIDFLLDNFPVYGIQKKWKDA